MSATFSWVLSSPDSSVALHLVAGAAEAASGNKRLGVELVKEFPVPRSSLNTHNCLSQPLHTSIPKGRQWARDQHHLRGAKRVQRWVRLLTWEMQLWVLGMFLLLLKATSLNYNLHTVNATIFYKVQWILTNTHPHTQRCECFSQVHL